MIDNAELLKIKTWGVIVLLACTTAIPQIPNLFGDTLAIVLVWCIFGIWLTQMCSQGIIKTRLTIVNRVLLVTLVAAVVGLAKSPHLFESLQAFMKLSALLLFGLVVLNYEDQEKMFTVILKTVIITSVILSFLAIYEYYFGLWGVRPYGRVQVLFPNPNHFAGFTALAMTFALSVVLVPAPKHWFSRLSWLALAAGMVALFLTDSKGGVLSLFIGFSIVLYYKRRALFYYFSLGILIVFALVMVTPLRTAVFNREIKDPYTYEKRELYSDTLRYLKDYPVLGTGLETFKYYYPRYKRMPDLRSAPYVHNEVLNLWSDLGILGAGVFIWILALFSRQAHQLISHEKRFYLTAFMGGVAGIVAQSMFEFNLHDPAIAFLFVGMICTVMSMGREKEGKAMAMVIKRPTAGLVLSWLVIIAASLAMMLPLYAQNQAEKGAEAFTNQSYVQSMLYYQTALKCNPISSDTMSGAARVYYEQGKILKDDVFLWAAKYYFEKAVKLEPLNPFKWRELGIYQARLGNWREAQAAYGQALRLAPHVKQLENEYVSLQKTIEKLHTK